MILTFRKIAKLKFKDNTNFEEKEFFGGSCFHLYNVVPGAVMVFFYGSLFGFGGYINTSVLSAFEQELCLMSSSDQL